MADPAGAGPGSNTSGARPRVLHILASLTFGGIETWLVHMFRHERKSIVQHEVLLTRETAGAYESEVRALGIPIHRLPMSSDRIRWLRQLRQFLAAEGRFAAVHSHTSLFSGAVLMSARQAEVPIRIAHCHDQMSQGSLKRRLYRAFMLPLIRRASTRRIGISEAAIEEIAGRDWRRDPKASILLYGFDFSRNEGAVERGRQLRRQLGIPNDVPVIGHVGRFDPVKNHELLLLAFADAKAKAPEAQLVLVGDGDTRTQVQRRAGELGLAKAVHFPGPSGDVPAYMSMFDLFALPSFNEGLGIVVLEAQAAGTRCLVSDQVPWEGGVVPGGVEFLPLEAGAEGWAEAMRRLVAQPAPDPLEWRRLVEESSFGIDRCIADLNAIYRAELSGTA